MLGVIHHYLEEQPLKIKLEALAHKHKRGKAWKDRQPNGQNVLVNHGYHIIFEA